MKTTKNIRRTFLMISLSLFSLCFLQIGCNSEPNNENRITDGNIETTGSNSNIKIEPLPNPTIAVIPASPDTLSVALTRQREKKEEKVDAETVFLKNDGVRLSISTVESGFLYIVYQGSDGETQLLFPSKEYNGNKNEVAANQVFNIPNKGWLFFDPQAGVETIYVVYSKTKDKLIGKNKKDFDVTFENKPEEIVAFLSDLRGVENKETFTTTNGNLVRVVSLKHE